MKKLNLGQELSKNEQKKILGGVTFRCNAPDAQPVYGFSSCSHAAAYCSGAWNTNLAYCY
ncbi:hypothetical protein GTQ34_13880 [Muricauda sp. JGD-17]|uniref:Uncharacterized protein n=1 Tax=Flagellimonas ochracea TaxID=2696472 RepID=A0A964WYV9_9FLAO|nr:hypothetical protein [Allomuricauda ochracea]NAY93009.1 hypothetical protein [Allomuricauda ochracea]